ncbi:MAG TPA: HEAT repeat domain-containing protein [Tepidisphaeraceae bacterium]|jgi:hypothetical protein
MSRHAGLILILLALGPLACRGPAPAPSLSSNDPQARILGIRQAASQNDRAALPQLVQALDDEDPAVRLFAIGALEKFAGDRFGYEYYFDEDQRKPSLERWRAWLERQRREREPVDPPSRSK